MDSVNVNVNIELNDELVSDLSDKIYDHLEDRLKDEVKDTILEEIDVDDHISNWMSYNFDLEDYIRDINLNDYIDKEIDTGDVEVAAKDLLQGYSPTNTCSTGEAFTEAVSKAIRYLLLKDEFAEYLTKSIDRYNRHKLKYQIQEELKEKHYNEFKADLEKLKENERINSYPSQFIV